MCVFLLYVLIVLKLCIFSFFLFLHCVIASDGLCQDQLCKHWSRHSYCLNWTMDALHWQDFRPLYLTNCSRY